MKRTSLTGAALVIAPLTLNSLTLASVARADANLNCDAYATAAVGENQQNVALGCGFVGPAWSNDFPGHRGWCLLPATEMSDLVREDNARVVALEQCRVAQATGGPGAILPNVQILPLNPADLLGLNPQPEPPKPVDLFGLNPQPEPPS